MESTLPPARPVIRQWTPNLRLDVVQKGSDMPHGPQLWDEQEAFDGGSCEPGCYKRGTCFEELGRCVLLQASGLLSTSIPILFRTCALVRLQWGANLTEHTGPARHSLHQTQP